MATFDRNRGEEERWIVDCCHFLFVDFCQVAKKGGDNIRERLQVRNSSLKRKEVILE